MPPLTRLERLVLDSGIYFPELGFDATCDLYRAALRAEIDRRLREIGAHRAPIIHGAPPIGSRP
jgi:hypothetical protein